MAHAQPLGLPLGLQLYSVRDQLQRDFPGTLKQVGSLGYKEVEAAGFYGRTAKQTSSAMQAAGLRCVSAHYPLPTLQPQLEEIIGYGKELGLEYIVCSSPGRRDGGKASTGGKQPLDLDDWRWNAEQFNRIGETVHAAGLRFGYHNHTEEFRRQQGVLPYDELLRLTDPAKVTMEMDCGWVIVGGQSPVEYLKRYPTRFSMLHVKDFRSKDFKVGTNGSKAPASGSAEPVSTELGRGSIDYRPIFEAARKAPIRHAFVEQESFDMEPFAALKIDAEYMRRLQV
ncbi:MAG: sugar phosphate isomerase/epimerase family protein [Acidobacteriaceae bacterium]